MRQNYDGNLANQKLCSASLFLRVFQGYNRADEEAKKKGLSPCWFQHSPYLSLLLPSSRLQSASHPLLTPRSAAAVERLGGRISQYLDVKVLQAWDRYCFCWSRSGVVFSKSKGPQFRIRASLTRLPLKKTSKTIVSLLEHSFQEKKCQSQK